MCVHVCVRQTRSRHYLVIEYIICYDNTNEPAEIIIDDDANIFLVADRANERIQVFWKKSDSKVFCGCTSIFYVYNMNLLNAQFLWTHMTTTINLPTFNYIVNTLAKTLWVNEAEFIRMQWIKPCVLNEI